jgi:hypothetical protein
MTPSPPFIAAVGDVHGHLQLALCVLARWQRRLDVKFEAVLLCGDVGTFAEEGQVDNATRKHGQDNPCELEFLRQWSTEPPAPWIGRIFRERSDGGLGLTCPVVMVHGNHEGFDLLHRLIPATSPQAPMGVSELPAVDPGGRIRLLPSGWRAVTRSGLILGAVGGIERQPRQRRIRHHSMTYLDEEAVLGLWEGGPLDILITHQGPSAVQGESRGSKTLQVLLDEGVSRVWFHGHSVANPGPVRGGRGGRTNVVPLRDIAFHPRWPGGDEPGKGGWALARFEGDEVHVQKEDPPFLHDFRRSRWIPAADGSLICPTLANLGDHSASLPQVAAFTK